MPRSDFITNAAISNENPKSADIVVKLDKIVRTDSKIQIVEAIYNKNIEEMLTMSGINPADNPTIQLGPYEYNSRIHYILRPTDGYNMIMSYYTSEGMFEGGIIEKGKIWLNLTGVSASIDIDYDGSVYNAFRYLRYTTAPVPQKLSGRTIFVRDDFKKILLWNYGLILENEYGSIVKAIQIEPKDTDNYSSINIVDAVADGSYIYVLGTLNTYGTAKYVILMKFDLDLNLVWSYRYQQDRAGIISVFNNKILITDYGSLMIELDTEGNISKVVSYDVGGSPVNIGKIVRYNGTLYLLGSISTGNSAIIKISESNYSSISVAKEYDSTIDMRDMSLAADDVPKLIVVGTDYSANVLNGEDAYIAWILGDTLDISALKAYGFPDISHLNSVIAWQGRALAVGDTTEQVDAAYATARLFIADDGNLTSATNPQIIDDKSSVTVTDITSSTTGTIISNHGITKVATDLNLQTPNIEKEDITSIIQRHVYIGPQ